MTVFFHSSVYRTLSNLVVHTILTPHCLHRVSVAVHTSVVGSTRRPSVVVVFSYLSRFVTRTRRPSCLLRKWRVRTFTCLLLRAWSDEQNNNTQCVLQCVVTRPRRSSPPHAYVLPKKLCTTFSITVRDWVTFSRGRVSVGARVACDA